MLECLLIVKALQRSRNGLTVSELAVMLERSHETIRRHLRRVDLVFPLKSKVLYRGKKAWWIEC